MHLTTHRIDSPFGRWTHSEWRPPAGTPLHDVVDFIWHFDGAIPSTRERVFPTPRLEIIVHFDDVYRVVDRTGTYDCPVVCMTGIQTAPILIEPPRRRNAVMGIRLRPTGACALVGGAVHEATGRTVDLDAMIGRAAGELAERCADGGDAASRVASAVSWLEARHAAARGADPWVRAASAYVERCAGVLSIARLRSECGVSAARFASVFEAQVGMTPKRFARLVRFRRVAAALHDAASGGARLSLSRLSFACGYADQPHMTREFRALAGVTPTEYLDAAHYPHSPNTAESRA